MVIKSLGRWASSSSKKPKVHSARHLMHLLLIPRDDIPGFTGSAVEMVHEINNDWLVGKGDREAVQMPTVYAIAAKTHLDEGCSTRDLVHLSFDRSAWLATIIQSICFDCKNKTISVVFEQAEIDNDYEAEMPDKYCMRLLHLSQRLRTANSAARDGILKEIKSYLLDIYSIHLIPLLKTRPHAPKTFLAWALAARKREALDDAILISQKLAERLQRHVLDPELADWCSLIVDSDAADIRDELLYLDDTPDEDAADLAAASSDSAADVFHDTLLGDDEGADIEEVVPKQEEEDSIVDDGLDATDAGGTPSAKNIFLCPPDLRKRGLNLDDTEWNIIDHSLLGVVNHLNTYERIQAAIAAESKAEEAYHAAYRKHKTDSVSAEKDNSTKENKTQDPKHPKEKRKW